MYNIFLKSDLEIDLFKMLSDKALLANLLSRPYLPFAIMIDERLLLETHIDAILTRF